MATTVVLMVANYALKRGGMLKSHHDETPDA